jgi:hypothetical protein
MVLKIRILTYAHPKYKGMKNNEVLFLIIYPIFFVQHDGHFTYMSRLSWVMYVSLGSRVDAWYGGSKAVDVPFHTNS